MSPDQVLIIIAIVTAAWTGNRILRGPIGEAFARRIGGSARPTAEHEGEIADLRARMGELEERVDFAERLLARGPAAPTSFPQGGP